MSKAKFINSLQFETKPLSPYDISQRLCQDYACVSICQMDPDLRIEVYRGYMVRFAEKPDRSPQNPELYTCVVSLRQSLPWQQIVWAKEILQILDRAEHRTNSRLALGHMMDNREVFALNGRGTPLNVMADKNGLTLALGSKVPRTSRNALRNARVRPSNEALEGILLVPIDFIPWLLSEEFETDFERALAECDS